MLSQYLALQNVLRRRRRDGADCDDTTIALCSVLELDAGGTGLISIVAAQRMLRTDTTGTTEGMVEFSCCLEKTMDEPLSDDDEY